MSEPIATQREGVADSLRLPLLVLRCQAGDDRAFAALMDAFGPRTLRYLRGLLGDDGDDVQQEVWVSVYRNLKTLGDPRAFRTWLFRTTRHRAIDFLRGRRRERELMTDSENAIDAIPADHADAPLSLAESDLEHALASLSTAQREVILLRFQDEMSYEEIAVVLGCSVGTVRSRLHYAKERIHTTLTRGTQ